MPIVTRRARLAPSPFGDESFGATGHGIVKDGRHLDGPRAFGRGRVAPGGRRVDKGAGDEGRGARQEDRIQVPDRDALVNGECAGAVAGSTGDREPRVEECAVGTDAELTAGAG
jgi:hypothetical protein